MALSRAEFGTIKYLVLRMDRLIPIEWSEDALHTWLPIFSSLRQITLKFDQPDSSYSYEMAASPGSQDMVGTRCFCEKLLINIVKRVKGER